MDYTKTHNIQMLLIDNADEYDYNDNNDEIPYNKQLKVKDNENTLNDTNDDDNSIYLVYNDNVDSDNPTISHFLNFCITNGLFDNTFYDTRNIFSVVATKLPVTFEKLSANGTDIKKKSFITKFKKIFNYDGDINYIYNTMDTEKKGFVTMDDFVDFFLPFVQYVTI